MKLLAATVEHYRIHRALSVRFDGQLVLIHGPNESGKSTLAEAIHCALFLKAKGNTVLHESMESRFGGTPAVTVEFEAGGSRHVVKKTFGKSGNTTLDSEGRATLNGPEAEERLARLLGVDGAVSGGGIENKMRRRWAHLWVWQGRSSGSPLKSMEESRQQLRDRLQQESGQTILSSPADHAVIESLQAWVDANLTAAGKPKAGSGLDRAEKEYAEAKANRDAKHAALEALHQAAADYLQADDDAGRLDRSLEEAESRLSEVRGKLKTVVEIRERLKGKVRRREAAEKALGERREADQEIRELETKQRGAAEAAAPGAERIKALQADMKSAKTQWEDARQAKVAVSGDLKRRRAEAGALQAHRDALRESQRAASLEKSLGEIRKLQARGQELRERLAPLEKVTEDAVKRLAKLSRTAEKARLRLETFALEVRVLESDQFVELDHFEVPAGESRTLEHPAELRVGAGVRIRLSPGGAEDLVQARQARDDADAQLAGALRAMAASSVEAARDRLREREHLQRDLESVIAQLNEREPEKVEAELSAAREAAARLRAQRDGIPDGMTPPEFPDQIADAYEAVEGARSAVDQKQQAFDAAEAAEEARRKAFERASGALAKEEKSHQKRVDEVNALRSRLNYALEKAGDAGTRATRINEASAELDQARASEKEDGRALEAAGYEKLELDQKRLVDAIEGGQEKRKDAERRKIEAQTQLTVSGNVDPEREAKEAGAVLERAQRRRDALQHQANVRRALLQRLCDARQATNAALTQPLENAVAPYLAQLFGGSRAKLHWSKDGAFLEAFELDRTGQGGGVFRFDDLSYGTRAQVGLCLRLAMAELLAAGHDGCLPVVLDDAFTHADRERIEKLKNILYRASENGLQVIVLSCHPENYDQLNASEVGI